MPVFPRTPPRTGPRSPGRPPIIWVPFYRAHGYAPLPPPLPPPPPIIWPILYRRLGYGLSAASPIGPAIATTDFAAILRSVQATIVAAGLFPRKRCAITLEPTPFPYAGGPQCLIIPGRQTVDQANLAGGGRFVNTIEAEFEIHVIHEQSLDHAQQDTRRLTDAATGVYAKILALADLLLLTWPADPAGNLLTVQPIRDSGVGVPQLYGKTFSWSGSPSYWRVVYQRAVTQKF